MVGLKLPPSLPKIKLEKIVNYSLYKAVKIYCRKISPALDVQGL
jgi:hypothetical protein